MIIRSRTHTQPLTPNSIKEFDQTQFFDSSDNSVSMSASVHIYVPDGCRDTPCRLHVAFHGCEQDEQRIREKCESAGGCDVKFFYRDAGYNAWAEENNLLVLYPQNKAWGAVGDNTKNPLGCWDWWGYSGPDYFRKSGKQIRAVARMINVLVGDPAFLGVPGE